MRELRGPRVDGGGQRLLGASWERASARCSKPRIPMITARGSAYVEAPGLCEGASAQTQGTATIPDRPSPSCDDT